ncbi:hypothetical protein AMTR_s00021p00236660 [Amborella trichopoda]|uniref:F-box associated domain-containing protein n=1 Tax=Amborella trichopoda TaxID=13333 RepID=W1PVQ0_AMBTC|nr:hypothetical protein AMTR_s00021p00236660 [Amborella trichopoda]
MNYVFSSRALDGKVVSIGRWCYHYNDEDHLVGYDMQREEAMTIKVQKVPDNEYNHDVYGILEWGDRLDFAYGVRNTSLELWILTEEEWVRVFYLENELETEFLSTTIQSIFLRDYFITKLEYINKFFMFNLRNREKEFLILGAFNEDDDSLPYKSTLFFWGKSMGEYFEDLRCFETDGDDNVSLPDIPTISVETAIFDRLGCQSLVQFQNFYFLV